MANTEVKIVDYSKVVSDPSLHPRPGLLVPGVLVVRLGHPRNVNRLVEDLAREIDPRMELYQAGYVDNTIVGKAREVGFNGSIDCISLVAGSDLALALLDKDEDRISLGEMLDPDKSRSLLTVARFLTTGRSKEAGSMFIATVIARFARQPHILTALHISLPEDSDLDLLQELISGSKRSATLQEGRALRNPAQAGSPGLNNRKR